MKNKIVGPVEVITTAEALSTNPNGIASLEVDRASGNLVSPFIYTIIKPTRISIMNIVYVSDVTAGNRRLGFRIFDGVTSIFEYTSPVEQGPDTTLTYTFSQGAFIPTTTAVFGILTNPFPAGMLLGIGCSVHFVGLDVIAPGDSVSIRVLAEVF